mmetsp:Transcript_15684/g.38666  ORF Transcript_15684/g.38666 Transcript_15684/m.38666 type:complete len:792 (-) Transcript_15684:140-2515(-)
MAHTAHTDPELIRERFDSEEELDRKVRILAVKIKESKHFCVFTGAGISTSAGIPDFRGPNGKWTLEAQGKQCVMAKPVIKCCPTKTHMALVELQRRKTLKYLISQNCDGIHRRSGIPGSAISELHGNSNMEECEKCGQQYFRDFPCHRINRSRDHYTGRHCTRPSCKGRLLEYTIDFGQDLPERPLERAYANAKAADVHLVLGSSLTVSPACDMPAITKRKGGFLCICNLQITPLSERADMHIFGKTDDVMERLMKLLEVPIPAWTLRRHIRLTVKDGVKAGPTRNAIEIFAEGLDPEQPSIVVGLLKGAQFQLSAVTDNKSVKILPEAKLVKSSEGTIRARVEIPKELSSFRKLKVKSKLHFFSHYEEPSLILEPVIPLNINGEVSVEYQLDYLPLRQEWKVSSISLVSNGLVTKPSSEKPLLFERGSTPVPCHWPGVTVFDRDQKSGAERALLIAGSTVRAHGRPNLSVIPLGSKMDQNKVLFGSFPELNVWGHSIALHPLAPARKAILFGGWDSRSQYNRLLVVERALGAPGKLRINKCQTSGTQPSHRAGSTLTPIPFGEYKGKLILFGGSMCKGGPYKFFNDVHILTCKKDNMFDWESVKCSGEAPSARAQHSAVVVRLSNGDPALTVIGGYNGKTLFNDINVLNLRTMTWSSPNIKGNIPHATHLGKDVPEFRVVAAQASAQALQGDKREPSHILYRSRAGTFVLRLEDWRWQQVAKKSEEVGHLVKVGERIGLLVTTGDKAQNYGLIPTPIAVCGIADENDRRSSQRDNRYGQAHARYCSARRH